MNRNKGPELEYEIEYLESKDIPSLIHPQYDHVVKLIKDEQVLKLTFKERQEALLPYRAIRSGNASARKEGRPLPYPGVKTTIRGSCLFLWREAKECEEETAALAEVE